jgi:hypothetical protein
LTYFDGESIALGDAGDLTCLGFVTEPFENLGGVPGARLWRCATEWCLELDDLGVMNLDPTIPKWVAVGRAGGRRVVCRASG